MAVVAVFLTIITYLVVWFFFFAFLASPLGIALTVICVVGAVTWGFLKYPKQMMLVIGVLVLPVLLVSFVFTVLPQVIGLLVFFTLLYMCVNS